MEEARSVLLQAGVDATATPTRAAADAAEQVRQAAARGCDTIFACGGDGTIHDVLQGVAGGEAALGIIPMGTANALAHDLALPFSPAAAARAALNATPRRIAVGRVQCLNFEGNAASRYFVVTAGVGVDAHLFYALNSVVKSRLGMGAYYGKATRLWLTHPMQNFAVEASGPGFHDEYSDVSQLLAVRIRNFGGILRVLAPGAGLSRNELRVVAFRTKSRLTYLAYILRGLFGAGKNIRRIESMYSTSVICRPVPESSGTPATRRIFVEADGELLGTLPAEISIVPDALTLLAPP